MEEKNLVHVFEPKSGLFTLKDSEGLPVATNELTSTDDKTQIIEKRNGKIDESSEESFPASDAPSW